ncbi:pyruvate dehydrogenase protein X component [Ceratobasidium sp. AG-Ba]|nr:pyruvate dehydrogenase protein X component [Ceratobasidium sp. AG-Ba]
MHAFRRAAIQARGIRALHVSARRDAVSNFLFPAMSPTMTEGGIASWKKKEGDAFEAGDILLEIETDKATMDVEAQDGGVLGKIIVGDGAKNVSVGTLIALLAEEGDDISNLQPPPESEAKAASQSKKEQSSSGYGSSGTTASSAPSPPQPQHSGSAHHAFPKGPIFPSVMRLLAEHNIPVKDAKKIKGTGVRGMLTKGDVLAHLGLASTPTGTYKATTPKETSTSYGGSGAKAGAAKKVEPLDAAGLRRAIVEGLAARSEKARTGPKLAPAPFDSIIDDYLPPKPAGVKLPVLPPATPARHGYFDGLI